MIFDNHLPQAHTPSFLSHLGQDCRARIFQDELSELVARPDQLDGKKETVEHMALHQTSRELDDNFDLRKWLRELANALEQDLALQLRLQEQVRHQLTLAHRNRTEPNFDDELAAKFDKKRNSFQSACLPRFSKGQARGELASNSSPLGSFISEMHFHIRSLDNTRFHIWSLDNMRFNIRNLDKKLLAPQEPVTTSSFQEQLVPAECRQSSLFFF